MKDILLVMSDQHGQAYTQMEDSRIETPNLIRLGDQGMVFDHCYCNAPLCVPSRMSFLSGKLPEELHIFNNDAALPSDMPTIAHAMGASGYHTALIGRMHFKGDDQKHGFDERLAGDITSQFWGTGGKQRTDFGAYLGTTNRKHCLTAVGGGYSPVMAYDELVFHTAMDYLAQEHEEPLFLVVGFYSPHFPFVSDPERYRKYKNRFPVPDLPEPDSATVYEDYRQECSPEKTRNCKAAYCGLVETLDHYVGQLHDLFAGSRKDYAFLYTSDHGEQLGKRKLFGKQSLYEAAVRVPLIVKGTGIPSCRCHSQVSLLDVSKTILSLAGITSPWHDGTPINLAPQKESRPPVVIQQLLEHRGRLILAEAVVALPYKAVRYDGGPIQIYHLTEDPDECIDLSDQCPAFLDEAGTYMMSDSRMLWCIETEIKQRKQQEQLKMWGKKKRPVEWATMSVPPAARQNPVE